MDIVEKLKKLGYSEAMAKVYIELLKNPGFNGTQIFKQLDLPRSSVYKALDELVEVGAISLIPSVEGLKNYNPIDPIDLTNNFKLIYSEILETIGLDLEAIYRPNQFYEVYNIVGVDNFYYKLNEMLKNAKDSIVICGNIDESRILTTTDIQIEKKENKEKEIYILVDKKELLSGTINGTYSIAIYTKNDIVIRKYME